MASQTGTRSVPSRPKSRIPRDLAQHQAEELAFMRAAYRLIGRNNPEPMGVQDILVESGLSTRAFYRHFASKDELIIAMYRADSQLGAAKLFEAIASSTSLAAAVEAWVNYWMEIIYDSRRGKAVRMLASAEARGTAGFRSVETESNLVSVTVLTQIFAAGRKAGQFPTVEPENDARCLQAAVHALLQARLNHESTPDAATARTHIMDFLARILGSTRPAS